jgi:hypothetical protein
MPLRLALCIQQSLFLEIIVVRLYTRHSLSRLVASRALFHSLRRPLPQSGYKDHLLIYIIDVIRIFKAYYKTLR